jgi:hypothetical protein
MWTVILKRRDYLEDIAINGRTDMHIDGIFLWICGLHSFGSE